MSTPETDDRTRARNAYDEAFQARKQGRLGEAEEALRGLLRDPDYPLAAKARFLLADIALERKAFPAAEEILRGETERLLSEGRRREVADIYLRLAAKARDAGEDVHDLEGGADPDKAIQLYEYLIEMELPEDLRDRVLFARARTAGAAKQWGRAVEGYGAYLMERDPLFRIGVLGELPGASEGGEAGAHWVAARLGLVEAALHAAGALPEEDDDGRLAPVPRSVPDEVVTLLDDLLHHLEAGVEDPGEADVEASLRRARFLRPLVAGLGRTFRKDGVGAEGPTAARRAVRYTHDYLERHLDTPEALLLRRRLPHSLLTAGFPEEALAAQDELAEGRDHGEEAPGVRAARAEALFGKGAVLYSLGRFAEAEETWQGYLTRFPDGRDWQEAQRGIDRTLCARGSRALAEEAWEECRGFWQQVAAKRAGSDEAAWLSLAIAWTRITEAEAAKEAGKPRKTVQLYREAFEALGVVASRFGGEVASQAHLQRARILRDHLDDLEGAVAELRRSDEPAARDALEELTSVELGLEVPRVFRVAETPEVRLHLRNVSQVTLRRYPINLGDFFSTYHGVEKIDRLDLDLVSPEEQWTVEVPDYRRYHDLVHEVPLQVAGPGAHAVTAEAEGYEATVLVLHSDLELVSAATAEEALVLVKDATREEGVPGARALVWGGERPGQVLELEAGDDGVARGRFTDPPDERTQVLVSHDGHVAVSDGAIPSGATATLRPRGHLQTSRPVYLPGERVPLRGVVRGVIDGSYGVEEGARFLLVLEEPGGRRVAEKVARLTDMGTFSTSLPLPPGATLGDYTARALRLPAKGREPAPGGLTLQTALAVQYVQPSKLSLELTPSQPAALAGDRVELELRAGFYTGAPLPDRTVVLSLPDGRKVRLRTDEEGRARHTLDTTPFFRHDVLTLRAHLAGEDVHAEVALPLLPAAVLLDLRLPSRAPVAGQRVSGRVRVREPGGAPVAGRAVQVEVRGEAQRKGLPLPARVRSRAGLEEDPVVAPEEGSLYARTLETDAAGEADFEFPAEDPGELWVVVRAEDAQGREVTETRKLRVHPQVSEQLEVSTDARELRPGETGKLQIRYGDRAGLGLLVFTGQDIFDYRVHGFEKGRRTYEFPVQSAHAPNFRLVALAPGEEALHQALQEYEVRRRLEVRVERPEGPLRPGETAELTVITEDERGAPVPADLCLSLVDRGLLARFADPTPSLRETFEEGLRREVELAVSSSVTFHQRGEKREIAREILAEAERLEEESLRVAEAAALPSEECEMLDMMLEDMDGLSGAGPGAGGVMKRMAAPAAPQLQSLASPKEMRQEMRRRKSRKKGGPPAPPPAPEPKPAPRRELAVGAAWVGRVLTGEDGRAQVALEVPERTSAYRLLVRGISGDSLVGEFEDEAAVRRDLYVDVRLPGYFFEGDTVRPQVVVHSEGDFRGPVEVELALAAGGVSRTFPIRLEVTGPGATEAISGPFDIPAGSSLRAAATLRADGEVLDSMERESSIRLWGVTERDGRSGEASGDVKATLELPSAVRPETRRLRIELHRGLDDVLVRDLRAGGPMDCGLRSAAARALALGVALRRGRGGALPEERRAVLEAALEGSLSALRGAQRDDGSWPWISSRHGRESLAGDLSATAWSVVALARLARDGLLADRQALERGVQWLQGQTRDGTDRGHLEAVMALATAGEDEFTALNRQFRSWKDLDPARRALVGLGFAALGKGEYASTLADSLAEDAGKGADLYTLAVSGLLSSMVDGAHAVRAALRPHLERRVHGRWGFDGVRWLGLAALVATAGDAETGEHSARVRARVGGREVGAWESSSGEPARFEVAAAELGEGPLEVELAYEGRGSFGYRVLLEGVSPVVEGRKELRSWGLHGETYYHAPRLYKGRRLTQSQMRVESCAHDGLVEDQLSIESSRKEGLASHDEYTVMTRWIPAGFTLDRTSLPSAAVWASEDRGRLTLVFRGRPSSFRLALLPTCPGHYRALPTELAPASPSPHLDRLGDQRNLTVLAPGESDDAPYSWSHRERIEFGKAHFADGEMEEALAHLSALPEDWQRSEKAVVRALLWIRCLEEFYEPAQVVDLFEVLEQRYPDVTLPYEKLMAVGRAYHDSGEDEAACLLWRATLESSFRDDVPVAAELEDAEEYMEGVEYLRSLYWDYPDLPLVAESLYGLAQDVYAHREEVGDIEGVSAPQLVARAIDILRDFLRYFGDLPYADEATFSLLNAYRDLGAHEQTLERAEHAARRYAEGGYADRFRYLRALAAFLLGRFDDAIEAAAQVAEGDGPDSRYALFILGQMYQAVGRTRDALRTYRKVRDEFADASLAIDYLERRFLELPEAVTGTQGEDIEVAVRYCNVEEIEVLAYKVDLMRLFLKERNLDRIAGVNLAGITPTCTFRRPLPPAVPGTTGEATLELPFDAVGAYLVLARSGETFASGLVLVTPLRMEVQEYEGAVRVTVLEGEERSPSRDVHVKLSDGERFHPGKTDLRGCATIPRAPLQPVTVVARRKGDEYAFFRAPGSVHEAGHAPQLPLMEQVTYDADLQVTNQAVQEKASENLRSYFARRAKDEMGVQAKNVRK